MARLHNVPDRIYYERPVAKFVPTRPQTAIFSFTGSGVASSGGSALTSRIGTALSFQGSGGSVTGGAAAMVNVKVFRPSSVGSITLAWDAVPGATFYRLYYGTVSGPPYLGTGANEGDSPINVGNVTQFTLTGLQIDVDYYFTTTAHNALQNSGYSNELKDHILAGAFSGSGAAATSVVRHQSFTGSGILVASGTLLGKLVKKFLGSGGEVTSGAATTFKVGTGAFRYTGTGGLLTSGIAVLKKIFAYTPSFTGFITIAWDAAPGATGYKIYYDLDSGPPYTGTGALEGNSPIDVGNVTIFTLHNLQLLQTYYFATTSYNAAGESAYSNEVSQTIRSGIFSIGGAASFALWKAFAGSGSFVLAGSGSFKKSKVILASGVVVTGGSAATVKIGNTQTFSYAGAGSLITAGAGLLKSIRAFLTSGGIVLSGQGALSRARAMLGSGILQSGGQSSLKTAKTAAGSGGAATGGAATVVKVGQGNFIYVGAGGVFLPGQALFKILRKFSGSGSVIIAGNGLLKKATISIGSGGVLLSGQSVIAKVKKLFGSGGIVSTGTATTQVIPILPGQYVFVSRNGTVLISGQSVQSQVRSVLGSGGVVIGGAATVILRTVTTLEIPAYRIVIVPASDRVLEVFA